MKARYEFAAGEGSGGGGAWDQLPEVLREDIEECAAYITEFGYDGGDPSVVYPKDVSPQYASRFDEQQGELADGGLRSLRAR